MMTLTATAPAQTKAPTWLQQFTLNANQIKIIALVIMTIDHIGAYMGEVELVAQNYTLLRTIGRIAAPLFLFLLVESIKHTRSRPRFALRLYIANLAVVAVQVLRNSVFSPLLGTGHTGNIFQTFVVTVLAVMMLDGTIQAVKQKDGKAGLQAAVAALLLVLPLFATRLLGAVDFSLLGLTPTQVSGIHSLTQGILPSILLVEYTPLFVLLGVAWHYIGNRFAQVATLFVFALIPRFQLFTSVPSLGSFGASSLQFYMWLAAPFMLLYNGQKGGGTKYFFYVYYILHPYVLILLAKILA